MHKVDESLPGPGMFDIPEKTGKEGPKFTAQGKSYVKQDLSNIGNNLYNVTKESLQPVYSFGTRSESCLAPSYLKQKKTKEPGPGSYKPPDSQFRKPSTKFTQAARQSLAKSGSMPGPDLYTPQVAKSGKS